MLRASGLAKRFGREIEAVTDASLDIERGRFIAIVGRSGSGKSTLLAMIGGLMRPSAGEVTIDGRSL